MGIEILHHVVVLVGFVVLGGVCVLFDFRGRQDRRQKVELLALVRSAIDVQKDTLKALKEALERLKQSVAVAASAFKLLHGYLEADDEQDEPRLHLVKGGQDEGHLGVAHIVMAKAKGLREEIRNHIDDEAINEAAEALEAMINDVDPEKVHR